jgi:hypothetical protein
MLCINIHTRLLELQTMSYNTVERRAGGGVEGKWGVLGKESAEGHMLTTTALHLLWFGSSLWREKLHLLYFLTTLFDCLL